MYSTGPDELVGAQEQVDAGERAREKAGAAGRGEKQREQLDYVMQMMFLILKPWINCCATQTCLKVLLLQLLHCA